MNPGCGGCCWKDIGGPILAGGCDAGGGGNDDCCWNVVGGPIFVGSCVAGGEGNGGFCWLIKVGGELIWPLLLCCWIFDVGGALNWRFCKNGGPLNWAFAWFNCCVCGCCINNGGCCCVDCVAINWGLAKVGWVANGRNGVGVKNCDCGAVDDCCGGPVLN